MTTPTATYRLQLQPEFPFSAAEKAVPRLARLGVSHLHLSPVLTAVPGSAHGYDVTDHSSVRAELGGEEGLRALAATARAHGLGLVLDIVPNHMAVPADLRLNRPLWEVLRDGPDSPFARWFDIDWAAGGGRVLLPVLPEPLRAAAGELRPAADGTLRGGPLVLPLREGTAGLPLPELLDAQHYRLAWWRLARTELNYRRFFTISGLIGVRVEDPEVFTATHRTVLRVLHEGVLDGLRVDHPDGLADPGTYLRRLHEETGGRWAVVEKILAREERLPAGWPVAGTTGYDALHRVDGVFTDPGGHAELAGHFREATGAAPALGGAWAATERRAAEEVVDGELAAETGRLVRTALRVCEAAEDLRLRDHAPWALDRALREVLVRLPVYRPYVTAGVPAREPDATLLAEAAEGARAEFAVPAEAEAVEVVRDLALGRLGDGPDQRDFAARFGQVSSALRAKAVEDTAFYRYVPLLSAGEVGGDPGRPAVPAEEFHAWCARLQRDWPETGTVLSTHDTKRSADVRAALSVLAECPERWAEELARVRAQTAALPDDGHRPPDAVAEWTAWQTAFGLGAPDPERLSGAVLKAVREAGLHTTWTEPDEDYETALERFVTGAVCGPPWETMALLRAELAPHLEATALGMALVHLTMPGVPELYWGTERHRATLVDPDNRGRPPLLGVDADGADGGAGAAAASGGGSRGTAGAFPGTGDGPAGTAGDEPGEPAEAKLRLTLAALRLRRARPEWFGAAGSYAPLRARGPAARHCLAFVRSGAVAVVATRLSLRLARAGGWRDTTLTLPPGRWRDLLGGREAAGTGRLVELLADGPVALLVREEDA
ncbi:malto-oligosyltrehalose synthase [Streptomyces sp. JJ36]|uniref:malto-oligosyltrehalose synthase n=1 Tax=Streptomyces sp. JJ36 TaxID=2736645 RepID=UPI001F000CDA|nr:malto-oligosyltrehalose synthase [Streptomyces sp. JJ36]MCF6526238.1 malto-oligosyltrehalose synthase [Streptomyces sp. JJ36]